MRASSTASTSVAPQRARQLSAIAASVTIGSTGRLAPYASPCATPQAVRTPVNDPGPAPKAMASQSASAMPASRSSSCTIGRIDCEWVRTPAVARAMTVSLTSSAQDASSAEVSMARMVGIPYFNRSAGRHPCRPAFPATLQRNTE